MRDEGEKKRGADWAQRGEDASLNRNPAKEEDETVAERR